MNSSEIHEIQSSANYKIIIPISIFCALISIIISCGILMVIFLNKRLHTMAHILICNTCFTSIFYSVVQNNNYIYLIFITQDTSDISCRFRAYFGYMSIAAVIYSYFIQALSRLFYSIFHRNQRWILSFKTQYIMILIQWIVVILIPLPAILTKDIYYRPTFLCWVPKEKFLHMTYTLLVYYVIPITLIVIIYINIYCRVKYLEKNMNIKTIRKIQQNRNLEILRNILILIGIYTSGGIATFIYITTKIEIFYSMGIVLLPLFVTIEKLMTILLDREVRKIIKNYFCQSKTKITVIVRNQNHLVRQN
ncbi:unnamed protein product [Adineta steineri]|uniref:G-protein coupled receptors family 1 profile domain-containing protein n=1 Tax=Adineta steineri TaxID=433720 RepID=A0A815Q5B6_9BILA|nr:unnamed protein product [Adineta steineri]CAF1632638.1 unnamed protein product [Adineta steineri]